MIDLEKLHPRMFVDIAHMNQCSENQLVISKRLSICRMCDHWFEDKYNYRCFACGCTDNILKKNTQCPLENNKW